MEVYRLDPSGKQQLWKDPPFFMGQSTISMVIFHDNYQRVTVFDLDKHSCFLGVNRIIERSHVKQITLSLDLTWMISYIRS